MLKIVQQIHEMLQNEVQSIALEKFYKGPTFTEHHRKTVYNNVKPNKQMAAKLQISNMQGLKDFQFHMKMGEKAAAEKLFNTYSKATEELKKKGPAIVKKLMQQNFG